MQRSECQIVMSIMRSKCRSPVLDVLQLFCKLFDLKVNEKKTEVVCAPWYIQ
jgi:hypothetical protein